ncbi:MAG: aldolase [Thermoanaerobacteraceae bacterium]|nr:aldolase [Thermoanaerobacteraceae bacterium]
MLRVNKLKEKLNQGKTVIGPFMKLSSPAVVEVLGNAGFDFVIIDTEHGPISTETAENLIRAAELVGITPIVRVSNNDSNQISKALDIGALGIQVPQISSGEDAKKAVKSCKYSPKGERGVCRFVRAASYSAMNRFEYFSMSNNETLVILQVEGTEGVNELDQILEVPDVDIIFLGPYDLSQSLGLPGQIDHPKVEAKMCEVISKAKKKGITIGTFVDNISNANKWQSLGVQYISYSVDVGIFYEAGQDIIKKLK